MTEHQDTANHHRRRVENFLARIERYNGHINALIQTTPEIALAAADAADQAEAEGRTTGALHGVVIALKDNIDTAGVRTTSGSNLYQHSVPEQDAEVWRLLREQGAILIAKAGLHELAFGATSQNVWYGAIRNPWNTDYIPGGSSGGSGAAVAADFCDVALGTDTGGSVRIPAAMCGVSGLRPTMGAVSNRAVRPISPHLDTVGPMARDVAALAKTYAAMQAYDAKDETSRAAPAAVSLAGLDEGVKNLRIGVPERFFYENLHPDVEKAVRQAATVFADLGARVEPIDLGWAQEASAACARIIVADAADYYHEFIAKLPELFSDQTMRRLRTGFDVSGIEYASHMRRMLRWQRIVDNLFESTDLLLTPTLAAPAPTIAQCEDLLEATASITPFTMAWALAGVPNLALACGFSDSGLPLSLQLAARSWQENLLFRAGSAFQSETDFHRQRAFAD